MKRDDANVFSSAELPQVHCIGLMQFDPMWAMRMHTNQSAEILYMVKGSMNLVLENTSYKASVGDILVVPPRTPHRDHFDTETGVEIFYCSFSWSLCRTYLQTVTNDRLAQLSESCRKSTADMFRQISTDLAGGSDTDLLVTRSRILTLLLTVLRDVSSQTLTIRESDATTTRRKEILDQAKEYLATHYRQCVSLDEVADAIDISPYYLSHVFSEESGLSLFSHLTTIRMKKAAELLQARSLNVSEVAYEVGYESPNYFSKVFRKHFGCSPTSFLKKR